VSYVAESERGYQAARDTRARLGLGLEAPIVDAVQAVEDVAGIPVTVLELPEGLAGLQGRQRGRGFIFVNGTEPLVRQRFTLAHEFGHVELCHAGSVDYTSDVFGTGHRPPTEVQADGFAAEFLAPADGVRRWLSAVGEPPSALEAVVRLADYFHVSAEVALYRLQAVRHLTKAKVRPIKAAIDDSEHIGLCQRLGLGDYADTLTRARQSLPRFPRATMTDAATAYERGLLTVEQIAQLLGIDAVRVRAEFAKRGVTPGHHEPDY
jgi:Zn-dependent peptidase ImmA (M78 family)